jgi:lysozyme
MPPANDNRKPANGKLAATIGAGAAAALIALVGAWEGKSNDPYKDIVGVWTVCYGETQAKMQRYSDAQCSAMLSDRLADYAGPVLARNPELRGHDNQVIAASSLSYNIGVAAYRNSTVAKRFSAGNWKGACDAILMWNRAGGRVVKGLDNRRKAERAVCLKGL